MLVITNSFVCGNIAESVLLHVLSVNTCLLLKKVFLTSIVMIYLCDKPIGMGNPQGEWGQYPHAQTPFLSLTLKQEKSITLLM